MIIYEDSTKVLKCYLLSNEDIKQNVDSMIELRKKMNFKITRTKESYIHEIKAHKRLYKLGLFKSHTKDADLEENIDSKLEIIFYILGI